MFYVNCVNAVYTFSAAFLRYRMYTLPRNVHPQPTMGSFSRDLEL